MTEIFYSQPFPLIKGLSHFSWQLLFMAQCVPLNLDSHCSPCALNLLSLPCCLALGPEWLTITDYITRNSLPSGFWMASANRTLQKIRVIFFFQLCLWTWFWPQLALKDANSGLVEFISQGQLSTKYNDPVFSSTLGHRIIALQLTHLGVSTYFFMPLMFVFTFKNSFFLNQPQWRMLSTFL